MRESPLHPGHEPAAVTRAPLRQVILASTALLLLAGAVMAGPLSLRPRRGVDSITHALAQGPHAGECDQCHTTHGDDLTSPYPNALQGPDDNALCLRCHDTPWKGGSFANDPLYRASGHGSSTAMLWPGPDPPARIEPDAATKCLNCHDAHGQSDAAGPIAQLTLQREEGLCLQCHDGSPAATNIQNELNKPYRHPVTTYSGRHTGPLESLPTDFGTTPVSQRHSECEDCHDPHTSRADPLTGVRDDDASQTTLGVSRVAVLNGVAGAPPSYQFIAGSDTLSAPNSEYQLCFKCHSSWTSQPSGQTDLALALNPANPSYHPVEAPGRDAGIDPNSFANGWTRGQVTRCGSCHGSDFGSVQGPHGSTYPAILRAPYSASSTPRDMSSNELCFSCHAFAVYGDPTSSAATRGASRFNAPGVTSGHAEHVGQQHVPCYVCHITHGSTTLPHLLVAGRTPGVNEILFSPTGGSCTPSCHAAKDWTANYAR